MYFFYGDIQWGEFAANIGFDPSLINENSGAETLMISIALTSETVNIEETSNVGIPGVYAFRVDQQQIIQPNGKCKMPSNGGVSSKKAQECIGNLVPAFHKINVCTI